MRIYLFITIPLYISAFSQIGINSSNPETTLDIRGQNHLGAVTSKDGVLVPRVNSLTASGSINGQLVYLIENTVTPTFTKGFYYWNDTAWMPFGNSFSADSTIDAWINSPINS